MECQVRLAISVFVLGHQSPRQRMRVFVNGVSRRMSKSHVKQDASLALIVVRTGEDNAISVRWMSWGSSAEETRAGSR